MLASSKKTDKEAQYVFSQRGRRALERFLPLLPVQTRYTVEQLLDEVDRVQEKLQRLEDWILETVKDCPKVRLLKTIPGIGNRQKNIRSFRPRTGKRECVMGPVQRPVILIATPDWDFIMPLGRRRYDSGETAGMQTTSFMDSYTGGLNESDFA